MYNKLEETYKNIKIDIKFLVFVAITYVLYIIATLIFKNQNPTILGSYIILISFMLYFEMLNKVGKKYWNNLIILREKYRSYNYNVKKDKMIEFSRTNKLLNKESIKEIVEHYRSKVPISLKTNWLGLILPVLTILITFINTDTGKLEYDKFSYGLSSIASILVSIFILGFIFNSIKEMFEYIFKNYSIDNELEKIFSEIYLEFDNYELEPIKNKKNSKTRKKLS
jgi:ABC-type multidrug transport system fused ATPase/permease subunit